MIIEPLKLLVIATQEQFVLVLVEQVRILAIVIIELAEIVPVIVELLVLVKVELQQQLVLVIIELVMIALVIVELNYVIVKLICWVLVVVTRDISVIVSQGHMVHRVVVCVMLILIQWVGGNLMGVQFSLPALADLEQVELHPVAVTTEATRL